MNGNGKGIKGDFQQCTTAYCQAALEEWTTPIAKDLYDEDRAKTAYSEEEKK